MFLVLMSVSVPLYSLYMYMYVGVILRSVKVTKWHPFETQLLTVCIMPIYHFGFLLFWFRGENFDSDCTRSWLLLTVYFSYLLLLFFIHELCRSYGHG